MKRRTFAGLLVPVSLPAQMREMKKNTPNADVHKGLVYARQSGQDLKLDLHVPRYDSGPFPLMVWLQGGGWPRNPDGYGLWLANDGFAVASLSYRSSAAAVFPAQIDDVRAAVRWLTSNAAKYKLNPGRIGLWGASSAGHLAALAGVLGDPKVNCVVDFFGPTDFLKLSAFPSIIDHDDASSPESKLIGGPLQQNKEQAAKANPIAYVTRGDPPFLIVHGDKDRVVPINQSELLAAALKKAGVPVAFHVVAGGGHGGPRFQSLEVRAMVNDFFRKHLKNNAG